MKAIIPAAGYATRMYPLTKDKPKSLLDMCGKPILEWIVEKINEIDEVDEIFIVTNQKFYDSFLKWSKNFQCNKRIKVINDKTGSNEERLGTIGDISFVIESEKVNDNILVVNGDNLFSFNLNLIKDAHYRKRKTVIALYNVKDFRIAKQMGAVGLDFNDKIIYFREKDPFPRSSLCSIGIYLFPRSVIELFKLYAKEGNSMDRSGDFLEWLYKVDDVYGFSFAKEDLWFDIGSVECYESAQRVWGDFVKKD